MEQVSIPTSILNTRAVKDNAITTKLEASRVLSFEVQAKNPAINDRGVHLRKLSSAVADSSCRVDQFRGAACPASIRGIQLVSAHRDYTSRQGFGATKRVADIIQRNRVRTGIGIDD